METRKSLLFSAGVVAIVALLAATNVFAQLSCTSKTTGEAAGVFTVTVNPVNQNGRTIYTYTVVPNVNKLFVYVKQGLGTDLVALVGGSPSGISYVTPHSTSANFPPSEVWKVVHHQDGVVFPSGSIFTLDVPERFKPEEGLTTLLLGFSNTTNQHCGPILGPTTPESPTFQGSPLVSTTSRQTFANGCIYEVTAGETDNIITSMTAVTQFATVAPFEECTVTNSPNICEQELGIPFCPPGELGRPPLQSVPGGDCYYPPNIKYKC